MGFPRPGPVSRWLMPQIGEHPSATVRTILVLPDGRVALGSDYGLTLHGPAGFVPFPWPAGARREARRVEALAVHQGELIVGTSQSVYVSTLGERGGADGEVRSRRHGRDQEDGWDDLLALQSFGDRLLIGWRTRLEGGEGPPDSLCLTVGLENGASVAFAGTRNGELHRVDGGLIRRFEPPRPPTSKPGGPLLGTRPPPVRHLAWADGTLWVATASALYGLRAGTWLQARLDDGRPSPEPTALHVDAEQRLWAIVDGRVMTLYGDTLSPYGVKVERPWCLAVDAGSLWIGGREALWRVALR